MIVSEHPLIYYTRVLPPCYYHAIRFESDNMADSGSSSRNIPKGGMNEHGRTSPGFEALRGVLGRIAGTLPAESSGATNVTPARMKFPLTSVEKVRPRTEPVFSRARSPVTTASNVRMVTQGGGNANPSPETVDFGQGEGETGVRRTHLSDLERKDREAKNLPEPSFDNLLNRLQIAGDHFGREEEDGAYETRDNAYAGNFHYLPSSHYQESSGIVPDRFHADRESLSVIQNITIRDSKRTKTRTKDDDYKRRVSISSTSGMLTASRSPAGSALPYHHMVHGSRRENSPSPGPVFGGGGLITRVPDIRLSILDSCSRKGLLQYVLQVGEG
jgi:hypothetical protein